MKRLYTLLILVLVLAALAVPAVAYASDEGSPTAGATADGWTWDEM